MNKMTLEKKNIQSDKDRLCEIKKTRFEIYLEKQNLFSLFLILFKFKQYIQSDFNKKNILILIFNNNILIVLIFSVRHWFCVQF